MARPILILLAVAALGFALAGCGSTSLGPAAGTGGGGNGPSATRGQDTSEQPAAGGLQTPAYTAAHNACSLYPLAELARQNNVKADPKAVAHVYEQGESTKAGKKQAYKGCLDALTGK